MKKYSKIEQRERSKRLEYFEGLFLSVLAFENETGKNDEFSYWTETEKSGKKILIPYCWSVLWSDDIRDCRCESETFSKFENQRYNEVMEAKTREIKEMQKEINRLNLRVEFWQKKAKKNG